MPDDGGELLSGLGRLIWRDVTLSRPGWVQSSKLEHAVPRTRPTSRVAEQKYGPAIAPRDDELVMIRLPADRFGQLKDDAQDQERTVAQTCVWPSSPIWAQ